MRPLSTYIEYLLMTRHYAFVPGLGGFMFQEEPARVMLGGRLMPPLRVLKYNRFLSHDDGMLASVLMKGEGLSYDDANQAIRLSVSNLLDTVQHEGRCTLGRLGFIFFDEECHIAFRANDQVSQDPVYYGMSQLSAKPWREVEAERKGTPLVKANPLESHIKPGLKHHDGIIELPTRWLRYAAVVLIAVCFLVANLIPWNSANTNTAHMANMVDTGCLSRLFTAPEPQSWSNVFTETSTEAVLVPETTTLAPSHSDNKPSSDIVPAKSEVAAPSAPSHKEYIVIVGSCKSQQEADRLLQRLSKKGYDNLQIYERNGRYRIYINKFEHKADAISNMNDLRQNSPFTDAWILGVRSEFLSLSLIIKNKDNDQLPMELSHLNPTAERDQG